MIAEITPLPAKKKYHVGQIKYDLDSSTPQWKVQFFNCIYLPFMRFCYFRLKLPTVNRIDERGRLCWEEGQGVFSSQERADSVIAGRRFWFWREYTEDVCAPAETCQSGKYVVESESRQKYTVREWPTVSVPRTLLKRMDAHVNALAETSRAARGTLGGNV